MTTTEPAVAAPTRPPAAGRDASEPPAREGVRTRLRRAATGVRARVVVGYLLLLATALGTSTIVVDRLLHDRLDREIELELAQETEELRALAGGVDPFTGEPFGDDAEAILTTFLQRSIPFDGEAFFALVDGVPRAYSPNDVPAQLLDDPALVERWGSITEPLRVDLSTDAGEARTLAVPLLVGDDDDRPAGTFVIAWFTERDVEAIDNTVRVILAVAATALVVTTALGWWLAGRVLRPVQEVTDTAQRITEADLSRRIPVEGDDELARLGTTFNAMLDRLESGFATQRQFLNDVAHELRTPITIARGHLELLGDDPVERAETVAVVTDELDRMSRYVHDLLVLAKAEQPDFLAARPVDVGELALDWLGRAEALGDRAWRLDAAPDPGTAVCTADPDRLTQAVLALATNAVQHTGPGDEIGIGVDVADGWCHVRVRDTGPGVAPDQRRRIFERAARAPGSRADRPEGTGLGLAIVSAIAQAHGGHAEVVDTPGGGATFVLRLPVRPAGIPPSEAT